MLSDSVMESVRAAVCAKFSRGNPTFSTALDNLLENYEALHDPDGWKLLGELLGHEEVLLFFNH